MMENKKKQNNPTNTEVVTSVGNSWVLCRSKSYSGRVYYFNTLTGEAVWNLSIQEIEKAKKTTSSLQFPTITMEDCPEPKDPPVDHCKANGTQGSFISRIYNQQIINNKVTKPPFTPLITPQWSNCNTVTPVQTLGIAGQPAYNPNVWAIQSPQFFITPAVSPMSPQNQVPIPGTLNNAQHQMFHNTTSRFQNFHTRHQNYLKRNYSNNTFTPRLRYNNFKPWNNQQRRFKNYTQSIDLRNILTARRSKQNNEVESDKGGLKNNVQEKNEDPQVIKSDDEKLCPINIDDDWLKEHGYIEDTRLNLDVTALKKLATEHTDSEEWCVVVDRRFILNHFKFLNILIDSDPQCRLLITQDIFTDLETNARANALCSEGVKERARFVLRFLSKHIASGSAIVDTHLIKPSEMQEGIMNFCLKLLEENIRVILLSNNEALRKYSTVKLPIFTIDNLKEFLINESYRKLYLEKIMDSYLPRITITIPNSDEMNISDEELQDSSHNQISIPNNCSSNTFQSTFKPPPTELKEIDVQTENLDTQKQKTVDTGVQTDFTVFTHTTNVQRDDVGVNTIQEPLNTNCFSQITSEVGAMSEQNSDIKRRIRLKRSASNQQSLTMDNAIKKQQFKWHRKRKNMPDVKDSISTNKIESHMNDENHLQNDAIKSMQIMTPSISNDSLAKITYSTSHDNDMESSDNSSCVFIKRNINDNIVIEETSNSDEISNSLSNVDSESVNGTTQYTTPIDDYIETEQDKNVMFEVNSTIMEESLKTRCDEWISRFVQIMEEVLTQILQRESHCLNYSMPPPWTVHEAAECIKKIFYNDEDVNDAASKLSQVLFKISDERGRINSKIKPSEFMELYSYGVYLIDALQCLLENCDDLQIASESLTKLLRDIQDPNAESGHNDSFGDITDPSIVVSQSSAEGNKETNVQHMQGFSNGTQSAQCLQQCSEIGDTDSTAVENTTTETQCGVMEERETNKKENPPVHNTRSSQSSSVEKEEAHGSSENVVRKHNLRSNKRKQTEKVIEQEQEVKFIREKIDLKHDFFQFLRLQNKTNQNKGKKPFLNIFYTMTDNYNKESENEPKVVRNFSTHLEYEKRLQKKCNGPLDLDVLDYSAGYSDDDFDMVDYWKDDIDIKDNENVEPEPELNEIDINMNNRDHFKIFVSTVVTQIQEAALKVQEFCKTACDELNNPVIINDDRKRDIGVKARNAQSHIENLRNTLISIIKRDGSENVENCQTLLKEAGVVLDDNEGQKYTDLVTLCINQGDTLLNCVQVIIDAVES